jgi:hypothetical protein
MDLVLGLSITSKALRWVLVEGTTGEGAMTDRGTFEMADGVDRVDPDDLLDVLLAGVHDRMHAVGVTWTTEAGQAASAVLTALSARGYHDVIAVSELEAVEVLAAGIADIAEYETVAVCVVEPDAAVVALVDSDGVITERIGRPLDGADVVELPSSVLATLDVNDWQPQGIFVVGSEDNLELLTSAIGGVTDTPVISAADAHLALARGAAIASARAVNAVAPARFRMPSPTSALRAVVAAAAVVLVASLSAAIGLSLTSNTAEQPAPADTVAAAPAEQPPTQAATKARLVESLRQARPLVAQTMVVAAPPAPEIPDRYVPSYEAPAAAPIAPPAPPQVYTPPAPAYVPPVPQPRLRDRILERIPLINRFHEPQYQYPR